MLRCAAAASAAPARNALVSRITRAQTWTAAVCLAFSNVTTRCAVYHASTTRRLLAHTSVPAPLRDLLARMNTQPAAFRVLQRVRDRTGTLARAHAGSPTTTTTAAAAEATAELVDASRQALALIHRHVSAPAGRLTRHQWDTVFHRIKLERVHEQTMPFWCEMKRQLAREWQQQATATPTLSIDPAASLPPQPLGRVPLKLLTVILQCIAASPGGPELAAAELAWTRHPDRASHFETADATSPPPSTPHASLRANTIA